MRLFPRVICLMTMMVGTAAAGIVCAAMALAAPAPAPAKPQGATAAQ